MEVIKNLFNDKKLNANEIAVSTGEMKGTTLDNKLLEIKTQITNLEEKLKPKDYITATIQSETVYEAKTNVPLTVVLNEYGDKLNLINGGIKIGTDISKVEISGQVFYWKSTNTEPYQWATINLNEKQVSAALADNSGGWASVHFSPRIIDVKEGDVITLYNFSKGRIREGTSTYISVKVIE